MANYAHLSLWFRDFNIERGIHHLEALLTLFPRSKDRSDFHLRIRSLDPSQAISLERELLPGPTEVQLLSCEFLHDDTSYEVTAFWDLWHWGQPEGLQLKWERNPTPVEFLLQGEQFDEGRFRATGHVLVRLGFEHYFTGHASILTGAAPDPDAFSSRTESEFAWALQDPQALQMYRQHTYENVQTLYAFLQAALKSLPVERHRLWSEGEADFGKLTERILAGLM